MDEHDTEKKDVREGSRSGPTTSDSAEDARPNDKPKEIGGRGGLDPTRYGDWEKAGRCIDF
jgi:hypothetical protein